LARYQPALLGGLFIGILSALPIIGAFNACCCLWVVVGGLLTTYLMQQNDPLPLETGAAAVAGLIAGAVGGIVSVVGGALVMMVSGGAAAQREAMDQVFSQMGDVPPEMVEMIERFSTGPAALFITAAVTIPVFAIFGLLGALLGLAFFRKKAGPAAA
jgi:hypothetical protein